MSSPDLTEAERQAVADVIKGQKQRFEKLGEPTTTPIKPEVMGANLDRYSELFRSLFNVK